MTLFVAIIASLAAAGVTLLIVGLRGRCVDDHRLCRRCGFDLFGSPIDTMRCSECGSDLAHPRAIRIGHRERRRRPIAIGSLMLCPAILVAIGAATPWTKDGNRQRLMPVWLLLRNTDSADLIELNRRLVAKTLSPAEIRQVIVAALHAQTRTRRPWLRAWGSFVETARGAGYVTDAQWLQYARNSVPLNLATDKIVAGDRHFSVMALFPPGRVANPRIWRVALEAPRAVGADDLIASANISGYRGSDVGNGGVLKQTFILRDPIAAPAAVTTTAATRRVRIEVHVAIYDNVPRGKMLVEWTQPFDVVLAPED